MHKSTTPLISLDAIALDTETTGLDARTARIVEIGALPLRSLQMSREGALDILVNPQCPIPEASSRIHRLTETHLRGAPQFKHVVKALEERIDGSVVIGHNIGYDLAVLDREYERAGIAWRLPRFLDVRALARVAIPHLATYDLDGLCDFLGVKITVRHRALPDAEAAGGAFIALVPLLRACGIRTLAEAEAATRNLPGEERLYQMGGWVSPAHAETADAIPAIAAIDSYPYRHRVGDLANTRPVFVEPATSLADAASKSASGAWGGLVIRRGGDGTAGFLAARDLLQGMLGSAAPASTLVETLGFKPLALIGADEFLYRAIGRMSRLDTAYMGVIDRNGEIVGTLSAADLLRHRATSALSLGDEIEAAQTVPELGRAWARLPQVISGILREGVQSPEISAIISAEIRNLTARAARLAEDQMRQAGKGAPPCAYALLVLGSAGRGDALLNADQDNAIVYASGEPTGAEDAWFAELGTHLSEFLNAVGVPYCPGGVMAKNAGCRHSLAFWKDVVAGWVKEAGPRQALAADIFFDAVPVHGDQMLADNLLAYAVEMAEASPPFTVALAALSQRWQPPINFLGRLVSEGDGRLDLKRNGVLQLVTSARALALRHGIRPTSTVARLSELKLREFADAQLIDRASSAYATLTRAILTQQLSDSRHGVPLSARVSVVGMSGDDRKVVATGMRAIFELTSTALAQ